jgi:hypothetical protein
MRNQVLSVVAALAGGIAGIYVPRTDRQRVVMTACGVVMVYFFLVANVGP